MSIAVESAHGCTTIVDSDHLEEDQLDVQDPDNDYFLGLTDFRIRCVEVGGSADVTVYWEGDFNTNTWEYRKFATDTGYTSFEDQVTYGKEIINGQTVTTVRYTLTDGGIGDADGIANGEIYDPVGPTVDTDDDGVLDNVDVDDDNDGILDVDERGDLVYIELTAADLGLGSNESGEDGMADVSSIYGLDPGSIVISYDNANTNAAGVLVVSTSQSTTFTISGTHAVYVQARHDAALDGNGQFDGIVADDNVQYTFLRNLENGYALNEVGNSYQVVVTDNVAADGEQAMVWQSDSPASQITYQTSNSPNLNNNIFLGLALPADTDNDGLADIFDIDSDNDGITDNVEAQTTAGYIAPSDPGAFVDANMDGLDDRYDSTTVAGIASGATGVGLTPADTDNDNVADYVDTDSDNDGVADVDEAGHGISQATIDNHNDADMDLSLIHI